MAVESHDKKLDDLLKEKLNYPIFNAVGYGMILIQKYVNSYKI